MNSPHTVSPNANVTETSTFLLDESGAEEPFFKNLHAHESTKSAFKKIMDSIKSTVAPEAPQPPPPVTYSMPFQPQANRYYETFKGVATPARVNRYSKPQMSEFQAFEWERRNNYPYSSLVCSNKYTNTQAIPDHSQTL